MLRSADSFGVSPYSNDIDFMYLSERRLDVLAFCGKLEQDIEDCVAILREWIKKQPHIPSDQLSDRFLEIYIIKNKFSMEKVKSKIESYCTLKNKPEWRYLMEGYSIKPSKEPQFHVPMPHLTDDFHRVFIAKVSDEERYDMKSDFTNSMILREFISRYDYSIGEIHIVDMSEISAMKLVTKLRANVVADGIQMMMKVHSARIKEIHVINKLGSTFINWVKPLLPSKMASRIFVHEEVDMVSKLIPTKCLPKDYGGELKTMKEYLSDLDEIYSKNTEKIIEYLNTSAREELRQGGSLVDEMHGTFRKMNID